MENTTNDLGARRVVAINASPRTSWNTAELVNEAARGASSQKALVERYDLIRLKPFTGCVSCFGCKLKPNEGRCIHRDGLTPVLDAIREADGLILGTPNYLGDVSALMRALYERLIFQSLTYQSDPRSYNERKIPVLLIMTSNASEGYYGPLGYGRMLEGYQKTLDTFVGPTRLFVAGDTLQVKDYSRFHWTMFDPQHKQARHEAVFPEEKKQAFQLGADMVARPW